MSRTALLLCVLIVGSLCAFADERHPKVRVECEKSGSDAIGAGQTAWAGTVGQAGAAAAEAFLGTGNFGSELCIGVECNLDRVSAEAPNGNPYPLGPGAPFYSDRVRLDLAPLSSSYSASSLRAGALLLWSACVPLRIHFLVAASLTRWPEVEWVRS